MCGFIGYIVSKSSKNSAIYKNKFNYFFNKQKYRGPDFNESFLLNSNDTTICVGFNRLSILDQSSNGNKIFKNSKYILLFNGEILNFKNLREKYFPSETFESQTDTELLFKFLIKFKKNKINELEGMFSFVLIDIELKQAFFCRDYTGIKPLYYLINSDGIFFSSDAWFLYSVSEKKIDPYSCKFYFQFGFTPKESTLIKNVKKILPSHVAIYNFHNNQILEKKYFELSENETLQNPDIKKLKDDLVEVVEKNLITDTKIGIFLSGGLDSTIIAILAKKFNKEIQAYTSYFTPESTFQKFNSDFQYSKKICDEFKIKLNKVEINEKDSNQKKQLINALRELDEPNANLNFFNSYLQSANAKRDKCKVILTGDGADEVFGGYKRYQNAIIAQKLWYLKFFSSKINKINNLDKYKVPQYFYDNINLPNSKNILSDNFFNNILNSDEINFKTKDNLKISKLINNFDLTNWLPEESNFKLDRSSMLNSIEARVPFQDKKLIQKYFNISLNKKIDFLNVKKHLQKLNFIPNYIKKRKKSGWFSPESIFLRNYLEDIFHKTFNEEKIINQCLFKYESLNNMYSLHKSGSYYKKELITLLVFQIWYDEVLNLT